MTIAASPKTKQSTHCTPTVEPQPAVNTKKEANDDDVLLGRGGNTKECNQIMSIAQDHEKKKWNEQANLPNGTMMGEHHEAGRQ
jgi:hypothetical protein